MVGTTTSAAPPGARRDLMRQLKGVDEVLGTAIERGDVPGIVAMAATRDGVIYQGAFGRRVNHFLPERGTGVAAGFRAGRGMGLRHKHRLGRQGGGARQRTASRRLFRGASVR